jgi:hypothetical protein
VTVTAHDREGHDREGHDRDSLTVTVLPSPHSIGFVTSPTAQMLTKRRAVDFCHVATAICPRAALSR